MQMCAWCVGVHGVLSSIIYGVLGMGSNAQGLGEQFNAVLRAGGVIQ